MKSEFHEEAFAEMVEAARFYDKRQLGLGARFLSVIERAVNDIEGHPRRWPTIRGGFRRRLVAHFPYGVIYHISRGHIAIVAIMHLHLNPRYWTPRLKQGR